MAEHIGGESLGGPPVQVGKVQKLYDVMTIDGECHDLDLVVGGTLINSTTGTFLTKNPTGASKAARSGDDVDAILDFIFKDASHRINEEDYLFKGELLSIVRSALSAMLARDVEATGCLVDGVTLNATGGATKAFTLRVPLPLSLRDELLELDGDTYKQGTEVVKKGGFFATIQNISGNVVLANGTATLAGLTLDIQPHTDPTGDKNYVGPTANIQSHSGLNSVVAKGTLPRGKRHFLLVDGVGTGPFTQDGVIKRTKQDVASIASEFNRNRRRLGGDNTCARVVPLIWPRKSLTLAEMDYTQSDEYVKDEGGASNVLISVYHVPKNGKVEARVKGQAQQQNAGRSVQAKSPTPPSAAATGVHARNASFLGAHIATK